MRHALSALALALAVSCLSGCGGQDYCDQASELGKNYANLDFTKVSDKQFDALLDDLDGLAESAPEEIEPDWRTLREAAASYGDIVKDAGISFDQLPTVLAGESVPGVGDEQLKELQQRLDEYRNNTAFPAAGQAIAQNLQSECDLDLSGTG